MPILLDVAGVTLLMFWTKVKKQQHEEMYWNLCLCYTCAINVEKPLPNRTKLEIDRLNDY